MRSSGADDSILEILQKYAPQTNASLKSMSTAGDDASIQQALEGPFSQLKGGASEEDTSEGSSGWLWMILIAFILLVLFMVWYYYSSSPLEETEHHYSDSKKEPQQLQKKEEKEEVEEAVEPKESAPKAPVKELPQKSPDGNDRFQLQEGAKIPLQVSQNEVGVTSIQNLQDNMKKKQLKFNMNATGSSFYNLVGGDQGKSLLEKVSTLKKSSLPEVQMKRSTKTQAQVNSIGNAAINQENMEKLAASRCRIMKNYGKHLRPHLESKQFATNVGNSFAGDVFVEQTLNHDDGDSLSLLKES